MSVLDLTEDVGGVWYKNLGLLNGALAQLFAAAQSLSAAASQSFTATQTTFAAQNLGTIFGRDVVTLGAMFASLFNAFNAVATHVSVSLGISQATVDAHDNGGSLWHTGLAATEANLEALAAAIPTLTAKLSFSIAPPTGALSYAGTSAARKP